MAQRSPIFNYDNTKYKSADSEDVICGTVVLKYNPSHGYAVPGGRYVSRSRAEILAKRFYEATLVFARRKKPARS